MENDRTQISSKKDILRGVYEDNKRIGTGTPSRRPFVRRTYVTGIGGVVLLVAALLVAANFVVFDRAPIGPDRKDGQQAEMVGAPGASARVPSIPESNLSPEALAADSNRAAEDAAGAIDALTRSPVPLSELFHLGVRTVVIDAGHGGRDPGALGANGLMEKEITLDVARRLARRLSERSELRISMTRTDDDYVSLKERAEFSNAQGADIFVSIHVNQFPEEPVYALETYYFGRQSSESALRLASLENENSEYAVAEFNRMTRRIGDRVKLEESRRLAEHVQRSLFRNTRRLNEQVRNWGVKTAPFVVLVGADAPGILAEIGVISNSEEESRLATPEYREKLALFLEEGIVTYLSQLSDQEASPYGAREHATKEEIDD
jgi:N-acetylmuramoyl-L-alanine amidase